MTPDIPYAADRDIPLGIPGFRYADLYKPERLKDLLTVFDAEVLAADPTLFEAFSRYRADPGKLPAPEASDLLMRMAPQVARFVARLFQAEPALLRRRREAEARNATGRRVPRPCAGPAPTRIPYPRASW